MLVFTLCGYTGKPVPRVGTRRAAVENRLHRALTLVQSDHRTAINYP